jgi:hypothetical protein
VQCDDDTTVPALDAVGSGLTGILGLIVVTAALAIPVASGCPTWDANCQTPGEQGAALAVGASLVAVGTATAFSAAYGYRQTTRCREIQGWQAGCLSGLEDECWKLYGPRARSGLPPPPPIPVGPVPPAPATPQVPDAREPVSPPVPPPEPKPPPPPPRSPFGPPSRPTGG